MLLSKLPGNIRDKWVRQVMRVRRDEHKEATLRHFIKFIHNETMVVNDPLFSKETIEQFSETRNIIQGGVRKRISNFSTKASNKDVFHEFSKDICIACGNAHKLDTCDIFLEKHLQDRRCFCKFANAFACS